VALQATAEFYHTWYEASLQVSGTDLTPAQSLLVLHRAIITVFFAFLELIKLGLPNQLRLKEVSQVDLVGSRSWNLSLTK